MIYPKDWPKCPKCGDNALDGHVTCGQWKCNEGLTRRERDAEHWARCYPGLYKLKKKFDAEHQ